MHSCVIYSRNRFSVPMDVYTGKLVAKQTERRREMGEGEAIAP